MVDEEELPANESTKRLPRRLIRLLLACVLVLIAAAIAYTWLSRKTIADGYIEDQLKGLGLSGSYEIAKIGPDEQIIRNLVIGDANRPDLTIAEVRVATRLRFGLPGVGRITLIRPRLYGSIVDGQPSFGALDKVLFTGSKEPFRLPDTDVAIVDGRALVESEYGPVGVKVEGAGPLRSGFSGEIAAVAPELQVGDCRLRNTTAYGQLTIRSEKPRWDGPLRMGGLACSEQALRLARTALKLDVTLAPSLDGGEGTVELVNRGAGVGQSTTEALEGSGKFTYRNDQLTARYDISASQLQASQASAARFHVTGRLRGGQQLARLQLEGDVDADNLAVGATLHDALVQAEQGTQGTLLQPLLAQLRTSLRRESRGSKLDGSFLARRGPEGLSLVVPRASLRGRSGEALLAVSRFQLLGKDSALATVSGNYVTGGKGLPRIAGRVERSDSGKLSLQMQMPSYRAADASIAVPRFNIVQSQSGDLSFGGAVLMSGALPGGGARNLLLPVEGTLHAGALALWHECTQVSFDGLAVANLAIDRRRVTVCPVPGRPLMRLAAGNLSVAGGLAALDLTGRLGETPIRLASGQVGFAYPGLITAESVEVGLGPEATASRFRIANLTAQAQGELGGSFDGSDVSLYAVPLDLHDTRGVWRYAEGVLTLSDGAFRLEDREQVDRFQPLIARNATLTLRDNVIQAEALLREPRSGRAVLLADIRHDLSRARGRADLTVSGITFGPDLQPEALTTLALGVVANTQGTVRGNGVIAWDDAGVKSTGQFSTERLDFAAAFGPVQGVSGTVRFTDLLGLVTAPGQELRVASINPGIEVNDGKITFALRPNYVIEVQDGRWPFVGGTLRLLPTTMAVGTDEVQRYTLELRGADAALFVQRLDIANLNATGVFDGTLPLVFDQNGGRIVDGLLISRPPGGNVSYVGELTYKDLSTMANFAFDALRSLDYREMSIGMNGAIEGELVTRLRFSGVTQGEGASRNFITRRIGKLPIQFIVNLRAPFFQLLTSFKSLYDSSYVRDPRSLGLVDAQGQPIPRLRTPSVTIDTQQPLIQPTASETVP
ncbi:intermembrane phospholipid transport protein YdbH family protein [Novosphingobium sp. M1R2S20]|uniref:YdbH domain-containing protein n=1 Tax=Novosphingobium rhizovicinum TaxID=3228928 RepID=A0ABV3RGB0_9SPHN